MGKGGGWWDISCSGDGTFVVQPAGMGETPGTLAGTEPDGSELLPVLFPATVLLAEVPPARQEVHESNQELT